MHSKKTAFIVEHDFIMATYLADRVIVFDGAPSVKARANTPESLLSGCNKFLKNLDVTFRRDPNSFRPRINKAKSQLDQDQKLNGNYVSWICVAFVTWEGDGQLTGRLVLLGRGELRRAPIRTPFQGRTLKTRT